MVSWGRLTQTKDDSEIRSSIHNVAFPDLQKLASSIASLRAAKKHDVSTLASFGGLDKLTLSVGFACYPGFWTATHICFCQAGAETELE